MYSIALFICIITIVVFVHEYGHYIVARLCGVSVEKFSIGFGPALISKVDSNGTIWQVSPFLMGGYVKMSEEKNGEINPNLFEAKNVWQRAAIVAAGPVINVLLAFVLFTSTYWLHGRSIIKPIVSEIVATNDVKLYDIRAEDTIIAIDDLKISNLSELMIYIHGSHADGVRLQIMRDNKNHSVVVHDLVQFKSYIKNIKFTNIVHYGCNFIESVQLSAFRVASITYGTMSAIWHIAIGARPLSDLSGPIKISQFSKIAAQQGLVSIINFIALISMSLAIMNILPIPGLDGGSIFFYLFEMIGIPRLPDRAMRYVYNIGIASLMALMVLIFYNDIISLIK